MPVAEKITRNKNMYRIWKKGKKGYKKIARDFGLDFSTVAKIIRRYKIQENFGG